MTTPFDAEIVQRLARRALTLAVHMIHEANHRDDEQPGDPKVGGHPAACASSGHIQATLRLAVMGPYDTMAVKPHASPMDHALNFLLGLFKVPGTRQWMSLEEAQAVMSRLRQFPFNGQPVFQSYHAESDPDGHGYFPSGSVGIPPVASMYTALAYRYAMHHGHEVPEGAHHWSIMGDSEFREGSVHEAMPEAAERELPNVTWIVDYNRQNLDGTRLPNARGLKGTDAERMTRVAEANGWDSIQVIHGRKRLEAFKGTHGELLREVLEHDFGDSEFQSLLFKRDGALIRERLVARDRKLEEALSKRSDDQVRELFEDLGGHDVQVLRDALEHARETPEPTLVVCHTIKGWNLSSQAAPGNHSSIPPKEEVIELLRREGIDPEKENPYQRPAKDSDEGRYLAARGAEMREGVEKQWALKDRNLAKFRKALDESGPLPDDLGIDLKFTPVAHTQYVWGQAIGKLIRIGTGQHVEGTKISEKEKPFAAAADMMLTMAPDVGTSTNINPAMDDKIYGPPVDEDYEKTFQTRDRRRPSLVPKLEVTTRHIRFEITEANCMTAVGAFGKLGDSLGLPYLPVMTIYDFFIKRAYDQLYYNLYWNSRFILVGTPSGVTLSPEGAQHSWKSDIQMPNCITWEPAYGVEVDWIVTDTLKRHVTGDDEERTGVIIRAVTRGIEQREMLKRLREHKRFADAEDEQILAAVRPDALAGGYWLVDHRGAEHYSPGENVVHVVVMGSLVTEALEASDRLLEKGIFANVLVATSPDLLAGNLAHKDGYRHLRETLGIDGTLHVTRKRTNGHATYELQTRGDLVEAAAGRVPVVAVVDGEPGMLDNLGSIAGTRQTTLGLRKPSKCGRPSDVFGLHHIDAAGIVDASQKVLEESALEQVIISRSLLDSVAQQPMHEATQDEARG